MFTWLKPGENEISGVLQRCKREGLPRKTGCSEIEVFHLVKLGKNESKAGSCTNVSLSSCVERWLVFEFTGWKLRFG